MQTLRRRILLDTFCENSIVVATPSRPRHGATDSAGDPFGFTSTNTAQFSRRFALTRNGRDSCSTTKQHARRHLARLVSLLNSLVVLLVPLIFSSRSHAPLVTSQLPPHSGSLERRSTSASPRVRRVLFRRADAAHAHSAFVSWWAQRTSRYSACVLSPSINAATPAFELDSRWRRVGVL